ncbi:hypothetical protein HYH03_002452 [Edaphochlamys debaryana]|uniref:SAM-dependent MTase RsmB/NOP-type domain-containing protein n=1 Tax=Edaphochlamys debaryana TaxID=47281 RepID=A0A835YJ19_9CHLO|nr:hypothetical protein HYH03_002452 [Edaphochlamys debaryana]|eukprot:KAG2499505.1 hypothetical protein HYH03_002452 [Edaphochlamys debaryana]
MPKPKRRAPLVSLPKRVEQPKPANVTGGAKKTPKPHDASTKPGRGDKGRPGHGNAGGAGGKRKRASEGGQAGGPGAGAPPKRRKTAGAPGGKGGHRSGSSAEHLWRPVSTVHQQAAFAVQRLLEADRDRRHGASLKSLTLAPHIVAKKATYAVTCQVLKLAEVLQRLVAAAGLTEQPKLGAYVAMVLVYDLLKGETLRKGQAERAVIAAEPKLRSALDRELKAAGVKTLEELCSAQQQQAAAGGAGGAGGGAGAAVPHPRWVRVNTLKCADVDEAVRQLDEHLRTTSPSSASAVQRDDLVPYLLALPPGTALHDHPLVAAGRAVLQSKASCLPAAALAPQPGWTVVDACAAPGNKTTQLAAIMGNKGRVIAFDKDPQRLARLRANAALTGAERCIEARCGDFLAADPTAPEFAQVRAVLLDPSCSGSGTTFTRMDHLLPSHRRQGGQAARGQGEGKAAAQAAAQAAEDDEDEEQEEEDDEAASDGSEKGDDAPGGEAGPGRAPLDPAEAARVAPLARFQAAALAHALRFPGLQRLVYSTCSVHAEENEDVVAGALAAAEAAGLELADPFPTWHRRGLPLFPGAEKLIRTDAYQDGTDGFFVALFVRKGAEGGQQEAKGGKQEGKGKASAGAGARAKAAQPADEEQEEEAEHEEGGQEEVEEEEGGRGQVRGSKGSGSTRQQGGGASKRGGRSAGGGTGGGGKGAKRGKGAGRGGK